jgi:hypothetical protein
VVVRLRCRLRNQGGLAARHMSLFLCWLRRGMQAGRFLNIIRRGLCWFVTAQIPCQVTRLAQQKVKPTLKAMEVRIEILARKASCSSSSPQSPQLFWTALSIVDHISSKKNFPRPEVPPALSSSSSSNTGRHWEKPWPSVGCSFLLDPFCYVWPPPAAVFFNCTRR